MKTREEYEQARCEMQLPSENKRLTTRADDLQNKVRWMERALWQIAHANQQPGHVDYMNKSAVAALAEAVLRECGMWAE
jgi:hypothetical protein